MGAEIKTDCDCNAAKWATEAYRFLQELVATNVDNEVDWAKEANQLMLKLEDRGL